MSRGVSPAPSCAASIKGPVSITNTHTSYRTQLATSNCSKFILYFTFAAVAMLKLPETLSFSSLRTRLAWAGFCYSPRSHHSEDPVFDFITVGITVLAVYCMPNKSSTVICCHAYMSCMHVNYCQVHCTVNTMSITILNYYVNH